MAQSAEPRPSPTVRAAKADEVVEVLRSLAPRLVLVVAETGSGASRLLDWCGGHLRWVQEFPEPTAGSVTVLMRRYASEADAVRLAALTAGLVSVRQVRHLNLGEVLMIEWPS